MQRLKNKLGTRQLPTAELLLDGTQAQLVSWVTNSVVELQNIEETCILISTKL